jgi:hypothetical protein
MTKKYKNRNLFDKAMDKLDVKLNVDVYDWTRLFPCRVPKTPDE